MPLPQACYLFWAFGRWLPFAQPIVILTDVKLVRAVLSPKNYGKFTKGLGYDAAMPLIGRALLALPDGDEWKLHRRIAQSAFRPMILSRTVAVATRLAATLSRNWVYGRGMGGGNGLASAVVCGSEEGCALQWVRCYTRGALSNV